MIPDGAIITYVGTWPHGDFTSADATVSQVLSKLQTSGLASVAPPNVEANLTTTIGGPFTVTLQLEVENGLGFSDNNDLISIVRHWVYVVAGDFPSSDSIPFVQLPKNNFGVTPPGGVIVTGQPGATTPKTTGCVSGGALDTSGVWSISCWWKNLTSKGLSTVGLLALAVVAGIAIFVVYGPQRVRLET